MQTLETVNMILLTQKSVLTDPLTSMQHLESVTFSQSSEECLNLDMQNFLKNCIYDVK
jgi:hypothetical protein